ncbi:MAG: hypothetical protein AB1456_10275 [Thermodesulfobacteriota bacterium]
MCNYVIWNAIFGAMDELRVARRIRSYTTLAFAAVTDGVDEYLIGSMNSASGLVAANFRRAIPGVGYFSISSRPTMGVVQVVPEGPIERSDNRHAEMNIVSFLLAQHLTRNEENTVANFFLDDYLIELLPSQVFCPECQLALCLLSRGGGAVNFVYQRPYHDPKRGTHPCDTGSQRRHDLSQVAAALEDLF